MNHPRPPLHRTRNAFFLIALVGCLILSGAYMGRFVWAADPAQAQATATRPPVNPPPALVDLENAFTAIAQRIEPSVVSIRVNKTVQTPGAGPNLDDLFRQFEIPGMPDGNRIPRQRLAPRPFRMQGAGSGVIVRPDGWILTNDHVVDGADRVTVTLHDGREFSGTVRRDFRSDLALVKINASGLVPADFGDSDRVRVGQWAVAYGAPFELNDTMTVGIVSSRHRQTQIGNGSDQRFYPDLIQTDAAINPGNSGGPLLDIRGRVIGINVAINSPSGGSVGIGFSIPSNTARDIMSQLIATGKVTRGFMGVVPRALTPTERQRYGVPEGGALIETVSDNTPASRAGFQVEDVVLRYDGKPVENDIQFRELVARTAPGKSVQIVVRRAGHEQSLTATVGTVPEETADARPGPAEPTGGKMGLRVEALTPENTKKFNVTGSPEGAVVVEVQEGGPADEAGIQAGDIVVRANGRPVRNDTDLRTATGTVKSGDTISLVILRGGARTLVTVTIP